MVPVSAVTYFFDRRHCRSCASTETKNRGWLYRKNAEIARQPCMPHKMTGVCISGSKNRKKLCYFSAGNNRKQNVKKCQRQ